MLRSIAAASLACVILAGSLGRAQTTAENSDAEVRRKGVVSFHFEPKTGRMDLAVFAANGKDTLRVDSLIINAIGDQWERGRTIPGNVERASPSTFTVSFGLPEGTWNIHLEAVVGGQTLDGLYLLGVGKYPSRGQFALTPPSPEVNRMVWIASLMLGVPLALGLVVTLLSVFFRARQTARAET